MSKAEEVDAHGDEHFRRIYDHLNAIVVELAKIQRTHIMILSGPDLATLVAIESDEQVLDRDVHLLERRLDAHRHP